MCAGARVHVCICMFKCVNLCARVYLYVRVLHIYTQTVYTCICNRYMYKSYNRLKK